MNKEIHVDTDQKFDLLRAIGEYLERRINGINMSVIADNEDGAGSAVIYWYTNEAEDEVDVTRFSIAGDGQIIDLSLSVGEWLVLPAPVRAFVRAYNHIVNKTLGAVAYADDIIKWEEAVK